MLMARFSSSLRSPLEGVTLPAWRRFVHALELDDDGQVRPMDAVSERGGFGSYDLRPRRLCDLGIVTDLCRVSTRGALGQRQIYTCRFLPPWTREGFLRDPLMQLEVLGRSMALYQQALQAGTVPQPPGVSRAGALAVLHCGGPGALAKVAQVGLSAGLFPHTRAVYERAKGAF